MEIILTLSPKPDKKMRVKIGDNNIHFGQKGFKDFIIYNKLLGKEGADEKRKNYIKRHSKMGEDWGKKGIESAGFWSRWLLWEGRTLEDSIRIIEDKFNVKIINKIKKYPN